MAAPPVFEPVTVEEAVTRYLDGVRSRVALGVASERTLENYRRDLTEFADLVGPGAVLDSLDADDVVDVLVRFSSRPDGRFSARPGAPAPMRGDGATRRFRQSVSGLFGHADRKNWVRANPMPDVAALDRPSPGPDRTALSTGQAKALLGTASPGTEALRRRSVSLALRDQFLLRLFIEAGPRVSEVCRADRADLQPRDDGTTWLLLHGKGRKDRSVPVGAGTVAAYQGYLDNERPEPRARIKKGTGPDGEPFETVVAPAEDADRALVLTWRGLRMTPRDVQLMVARRAAELPAQMRRGATPHALRHTAATLLLTSGAADVKTVQALLGHENVATTSAYLDTDFDVMAQAITLHPVTGGRDG